MLDRVSHHPAARRGTGFEWPDEELDLVMAFRAERVPPKLIARLLPGKAAEIGLVVRQRTPASIRNKIHRTEGKRPRQKMCDKVSFRVSSQTAALASEICTPGVGKAEFNRRCFLRGLEAIAKERPDRPKSSNSPRGRDE